MLLCSALTQIIPTTGQVFYNARGLEPNVRCEGKDSSPTTCYTKLWVPFAMTMVTTSYETRFHIADVWNFKELCNYTLPIIQKLEALSKTPFTCSRFFRNESMINFMTNTNISYRPVTYVAWQGVYIMPWWAPLFDIRNYCLYCRHNDRESFLKEVANNNLPYFWKHSRNMGNDGTNVDENPTILSKVHLQYIFWYKDQKGRENDLVNKDPQRNLTHFLYLTKQRNAYKDEVAEQNREEYHYVIYCSTWNLWGTKCDSYVYLWQYVRFAAWPIIDYVLRILLLVAIVLFNWIPRINNHARTHIRNVKGFFRFWYELVADIRMHTIVFMTIGIAFIIVEDSADFKTTQSAFHSWRGVFRVVSGAATAMGFLSLLVLWSHIYHSSQALSTDDKMNIWNKLTLLIFYLSVVILCVISAILYQVLADYRNWIFVAVMCFAAVFFTVLVVGFLVYGLRMYCMLRQSSEVNFLKLKFTKFMMVVMFLFVHYAAWTMVMVAETAVPGRMSLFMVLFRGPISDLSCLLLYPIVIYIMFERQKFFDVWLFGKMRDGCMNLRTRIKTSMKKKHVRLEDETDDEEMRSRAGLLSTNDDDSDADSYNDTNR